ncbi:MAG: pgdA 2 [Bacteroidetes bacterium]|nr:pgdA 2 [Bacteroidota bacterium]
MTFKNTSFIFLFAIIAIGLWHYLYGISLWWALVPVLLYKAAIIYGSANIRSNFYTKVFCKGSTGEKLIALTFDDGPNAEFTPQILEVLEEHNATATFFVIGKNIDGNEELLRQIDSQGHILGNHTFSHSFFIDFKNKKGFTEELTKTMAAVFKATGRQMRFFRPPYGVTTPHLAAAVSDLRFRVIGWDVRSLDTTSDPEHMILLRVKKQLQPGSIILFHDTSAKTVSILKQTLNFAKENGFKVVSTERLLNLKAYEG